MHTKTTTVCQTFQCNTSLGGLAPFTKPVQIAMFSSSIVVRVMHCQVRDNGDDFSIGVAYCGSLRYCSCALPPLVVASFCVKRE